MAQGGVEPPASLALSESGLPDCLPSHDCIPELSKSTCNQGSGRRGGRTLIPREGVRCSRASRQTVSGCLPYQRSTRESNPAFLPTKEACLRQHLQTFLSGAYGCRSRTFPSTGGCAEPLHQGTETSQARNSHSVRGHHLTRHQPGHRRPAHRLRPVWLAPSAVRRYWRRPRGPVFSPAFSSGVGCFLRRSCPRPRWLDLAALFYPPLYAPIPRSLHLSGSTQRDSNPHTLRGKQAGCHYPHGCGSTDGGSRTHNTRIKSPVLCQLSYVSRVAVVREGVAPATSGVSDRRAPVTPPDQSFFSLRANEKGPGVW